MVLRCSITPLIAVFGLLSPIEAMAADPVPPDAAMGDGLATVPATPGTPDTIAQVCADDVTLFGIDVSHWQGSIDWDAVAADDVSFAIVRVSDGLNTLDDWFDVNLPASRAQGLPTGVYQFFRPSQDPVAQAQLLIDGLNDHGGLLPGDLPPVIDVEATGGLTPQQVSAAVGQWINHVETELGVAPLIYTGKYFWQDNVQSQDYSNYPLWIAHYTSGCPNIPDQWTDWVIHQYSDSGTVAGVSGGVDSNDFNGDINDLLALTVGGGGSCGDGTCDPGETPTSCPDDCPPCAVIPPEGATLDETGACFIAGGPDEYWRDEVGGHEDHYFWTNATDNDTPSNFGVWELYFESGGSYELEVYVEAGSAGSEQSPYQIRHAGLGSVHSLDQTSLSGWFSLGEYVFEAGGEQWVRLDDNTGESGTLERAIVYDAIRLTPVGDDGGGDESGAEDEGGSEESGTETTGDESEGDVTGEFDGDGSGEVGTSDESAGLDEGDDAGGCACSVEKGGSVPASALMLLALGGLGLRRPRRRRRA